MNASTIPAFKTEETKLRIAIAGALVAVLGLSGCASIVSGHNQSLSVVAKSDAEDVIGARCSLTNDKGQWFATTPGSVTVLRSYGSLAVDCKTDLMAGVSQVESSTKPMVFGNIVFGGIIGVGVDIGTGAAYDYPEVIGIQMSRGAADPQRTAPRAAVVPPAPAPVVAALTPVVAAEPVTQPPISAPPAVPPVAAKAVANPQKVAVTRTGQDEHQVRQLARGMQCHQSPVPTMIAKGPGVETYTVACSNGDALAVRCEQGSCRALK